jgi:hypothetical protein
MNPRAARLVILAALTLLPGCGSGLASVSGRVTCKGQPLANAAVVFSPVPNAEGDRESGKAASGSTDADGRYVLTTAGEGSGALVGKHRVVVYPDDTTRPPCRSKVLTLEVKPGDNTLDIELSK